MDPVLISNVIGLTTDLAAKYVKPGSGIPSSDLASAVQVSLDKAASALQPLADVIRSTDANLSAAVNTLYHWDISGLTADRTLTLPTTAAVGDRVAITIATGDDAFEVLITAASGDTLATIAGGTEWSRLFITGEVVVMRCIVANTTWIVEHDGRIPQYGVLEDSTGQTVPGDSWTQLLFNSQSSNSSSASHANDRLTARRAGVYNFSVFWLSGSNNQIAILSITKNGATSIPDRRIASTLFAPANVAPIGPFTGGAYAVQSVVAASGDTFEVIAYLNAVATALTTSPYKPRFAFSEVL